MQSNLISSGDSLISYLINVKKYVFLPEGTEVEFVLSGFRIPNEAGEMSLEAAVMLDNCGESPFLRTIKDAAVLRVGGPCSAHGGMSALTNDHVPASRRARYPSCPLPRKADRGCQTLAGAWGQCLTAHRIPAMSQFKLYQRDSAALCLI